MQNKRREKLARLFIRTARKSGLEPTQLLRRAEQVIVFGSHGAGSSSGDSDLDVLCVGKGRGHKSKSLHIIWVDPKLLKQSKWLGSELATHLGAYGVWLKGNRSWTRNL